jgi:RNA polymerase sigma-70 factor (ECF subfamily)
MDQTPSEVTHLIDRLRAGDRQALAELFHGYRERLRRMIELRMDPRLRTRLDASDVLQEAYLDLAGDLDAYRADPKLQPLIWMRYFRALKRLKEVLASMPGGREGI